MRAGAPYRMVPPARTRRIPLAAFAVLILAAGQLGARPPNVVLIIADDQGWGDYGFMGHPAIRTPHLDRLASQSLVFTRGYVPVSLCRPSLATILTGLYPHEHGLTGNDPPGNAQDPASRARMVEIFRRSPRLPAILGNAGYASFQSGKWWEGHPEAGGFTHGMSHGDPEKGGRHGDRGLAIGREGMDPVFRFLDGVGERPFFLWYAPFLPHTPHNPPERLLKRYLAEDRPPAVARYFAMCEWFDETCGELLAYLDERGLRKDTLIVLAADNGWIQLPDGGGWRWGRAKLSPYDAGLRTPILLSWPGKIRPARDESTLASTVDLAPTVLALCGLERHPRMTGIDLLDRSARAARESVFGSVFVHTARDLADPVANLKYRWCVRGNWKLILPYSPNRELRLKPIPRRIDWAKDDPELFDVLSDPRETRNRAAEEPEVLQELRKEIDRWWPVDRAPASSKERSRDEEQDQNEH